uniref:Uncharacterized protein n=1 Tax=Triticum urartu TaxID=4572 RepID=A0A8R7UG81_TRIUA
MAGSESWEQETEALCHGYPTEFASYFHYCHSLRFGLSVSQVIV